MSESRSFNRLVIIAGVSCLSLASSIAHAQTASEGDQVGVEEIIVTAQKRAENLQSTPIAITALTSQALRASGAVDITGVVNATPSVSFTPFPSSQSTLVLFMRGQGSANPILITNDGGVGVYVDGIYQARAQNSTFDLADVERVEVLRGPQGTLYGRNTTGGAVNVISKKPTGEFGIDGQFGVGNYKAIRGLLNVNLPEFAGFKVKLTGLLSNLDGWARNKSSAAVPETNNFQAEKRAAFRAAVRWQPSPDVTVDYTGDYSNIRSTPPRFITDSPFIKAAIPSYVADASQAYRPVYLPFGTAKSNGHSLSVEWQVSDDLTLRSLTGYRHVNFRAFQDYTEAFFVPYINDNTVRSNTWTQEFQAVGKFGDQLKYVLGLYYFNDKANDLAIVDAGADSPNPVTGVPSAIVYDTRTASNHSVSKAIYGQITWTPQILDDRLGITVGGRYTKDSRDASLSRLALYDNVGPFSPISAYRKFQPNGVTGVPITQINGSNSLRNSKFNPAFTVSYRASDQLNTYAKVVTGYKAGGSNEQSSTFNRTYNPESVTSYEVGIKSDLFDRRVRLNIAGYIAKYKGLQIDVGTSADQRFSDTFNAGRATVKGIETDLTIAPVRDLTLNISHTYMKSKLSKITAPADTVFDPSVNPASPFVVGQDVSNYFSIPLTPKHSLRAAADWTFLRLEKGRFTAHAEYNYKGAFTITGAAGSAIPGYQVYRNGGRELVDARLSYTRDLANGKEVSVALWGKNVFDTKYANYVIGLGTQFTGYSGRALAMGTPATYGVDVNFSF